MINFDDITKENIREYNRNWKQIPDHQQRILITGGSESRKTNLLFSLISHHLDIDQIFNMLKIYMKQNISCLLTNEKAQA